MDLPMTFADFALTEARFRKHFRTAPPDTWNDKMVPLAEFLTRTREEREGLYPFVWVVDRKHNLGRLLVDSTMVDSCEDRQHFWILLRSLAGAQVQAPGEDVEARLREEIVGRIASGLMHLAGGEGEGELAKVMEQLTASAAPESSPSTEDDGDGYLAPWIDTEHCTACGECIAINPKMFVYNDQKKAVIADESAGNYQQLVKAAERCTAGVIHPGLPRERDERTAKLIARAERFN
jgi:pyruvate-ferredoxin/flavodoxin oxidoreductase